MSIDELRRWAETLSSTGTPESASLASLLLSVINDRERLLARLDFLVPDYERCKTDLEIAQSAAAAYSKELDRLRALLNDRTPAPWERPNPDHHKG